MPTRGLLAAALLLGVGAATGRAVAQEGADELPARRQAECRDAERVLLEGGTAAGRRWAFGIIDACPRLPHVLARLWRNPPEGERELSQLFDLSREVRDGDVFEAVFQVASSASHPALPRITALGVLASYVEPDLTLDLDGLEPIEGMAPIEWNNVWGRGADLPAQEVVRPLPDDFGVETLELVRRLQEADDSRVRAAAWWLLTWQDFEERAVTNPPPDTVEASWVVPPEEEDWSAAEEDSYEESCREAVRVLTRGGTTADRAWALSFLYLCPQLGEVLPALWREPPRAEDDLQSLFWLTRWYRDRDVFKAAFDVASSRKRPPLVRITALGVLGAYADSTLTLHLDSVASREEGEPGEPTHVWGSAPDLPMLEPGEPLPYASDDRTLELARRLAEEAGDERIRAAAAALFRRLESSRDRRGGAPPPPDSATTTWGDVLRSRHRIACRRTLRVLTGGASRTATEWAASQSRSCGEMGGEALAAGLRRLLTTNSRSEGIEALVLAADELIDRRIFQAALEVARDPDVRDTARVQALRVVYFQLDPGITWVPLEKFLDDDGMYGIFYVAYTGHPTHGRPLPEDALDIALSTARALRDAADTPHPVRTAARHLVVTLRARKRTRNR